MRQDASTISWAQEGEEWIRLAQTSDQRLYFVMPYMLDKLQDVAGKNILDLGCGEGGYARALARRGALVTAVDCNEAVLVYSSRRASEEHLSIWKSLAPQRSRLQPIQASRGCGKSHCICSGNCASRKLYNKKKYYGRRKNTCIFSHAVL